MDSRERAVLGVCMLVTFVTGSIHAFSVFLAPLEDLLNSSRAEISLLYSFALVFLTVAVLLGYLVYSRFRPAMLVALSCTGAGAGLLVCALSNSLFGYFLGYSLLFGTANGLAYGYVLQLAGRVLALNRGFAMSAVTAAYAGGSVLFSLLLSWLVTLHSVQFAMLTMGSVVIAGGILGSRVIAGTGIRWIAIDIQTEPESGNIGGSRLLATFWIAYGCAVLAGLMVIGHAAGMVQSLGGDYRIASLGAVFTGLGGALGGFLVGMVLGRKNMKLFLIVLPLVSATTLVALVLAELPIVAIALLATVGFSYGAIIAVYPYVISELFGENGPRFYGRVFTAWGFAGLAGPWCAGWLYDNYSSYTPSLLIAASIAVASTLVISTATGMLRKN